jgi:hypothetical protein
VPFGNETALIYPWQIVIEARRSSGPPQLLKNGAFDGSLDTHILRWYQPNLYLGNYSVPFALWCAARFLK